MLIEFLKYITDGFDKSLYIMDWVCFIFRFVQERTPNWFSTLKEFFETTPAAAVGEVRFF